MIFSQYPPYSGSAKNVKQIGNENTITIVKQVGGSRNRLSVEVAGPMI